MIDFIGLELIEFHDIPIRRMSIVDQPAKKLIIEFDLFDDNREGYIQKILIFDKLENISTDNIGVEDYTKIEINSFEYYMKGDLFYGNINLLTGYGQPDLNIDLSCRVVKLR